MNFRYVNFGIMRTESYDRVKEAQWILNNLEVISGGQYIGKEIYVNAYPILEGNMLHRY